MLSCVIKVRNAAGCLSYISLYSFLMKSVPNTFMHANPLNGMTPLNTILAPALPESFPTDLPIALFVAFFRRPVRFGYAVPQRVPPVSPFEVGVKRLRLGVVEHRVVGPRRLRRELPAQAGHHRACPVALELLHRHGHVVPARHAVVREVACHVPPLGQAPARHVYHEFGKVPGVRGRTHLVVDDPYRIPRRKQPRYGPGEVPLSVLGVKPRSPYDHVPASGCGNRAFPQPFRLTIYGRGRPHRIGRPVRHVGLPVEHVVRRYVDQRRPVILGRPGEGPRPVLVDVPGEVYVFLRRIHVGVCGAVHHKPYAVLPYEVSRRRLVPYVQVERPAEKICVRWVPEPRVLYLEPKLPAGACNKYVHCNCLGFVWLFITPAGTRPKDSPCTCTSASARSGATCRRPLSI